MLLAGGVCIGFAPLLVRVSDVGPAASAFWRLAIATPLLWILVMASPRPVPPPAPQPRRHWPVILSGLFFAVDLGTWHFSIRDTTVANATLLANCAPLFVTAYALLIQHRRPPALFFAGLVLALGGAVVLVSPSFVLAGPRLRGDALAVLAALFYTGYMLAVRAARNDLGTLPMMAASTSLSALVLLPVAWWLSHVTAQPFWPEALRGWSIVLALAVLTQVAGQGLIAYALAHLPVTLSTTGLLIQPMVAALAAWWLFGEALAPAQLAGAVVLLVGISLARRSEL
jgi:drug/metabolite transporter (DMT)-like permease